MTLCGVNYVYFRVFNFNFRLWDHFYLLMTSPVSELLVCNVCKPWCDYRGVGTWGGGGGGKLKTYFCPPPGRFSR